MNFLPARQKWAGFFSEVYFTDGRFFYGPGVSENFTGTLGASRAILPTAIPEPTLLGLFAFGLLCLRPRRPATRRAMRVMRTWRLI